MKKTTLFAAILLALAACKKEKDCADTMLTDCLKTEFEQFKTANDAVAILSTFNQSEKVYWFKYGTLTHAVDGCDYVLNGDCEVVCNFGGKCLPIKVNCPDFDSPEWEIIWEK